MATPPQVWDPHAARHVRANVSPLWWTSHADPTTSPMSAGAMFSRWIWSSGTRAILPESTPGWSSRMQTFRTT
jgi:hypothetical protein